MNAENKIGTRSYLPSEKRMKEIKREASEYIKMIGPLPEISFFTLIAIFVEGCMTGESKTIERINKKEEECIKKLRDFPQRIKK